jgi:hypothetical protein
LVDNLGVLAKQQRLEHVHKELFVERVEFDRSGIALVGVEVDTDLLLLLLAEWWVVLNGFKALLLLVFFLEHERGLE